MNKSGSKEAVSIILCVCLNLIYFDINGGIYIWQI